MNMFSYFRGVYHNTASKSFVKFVVYIVDVDEIYSSTSQVTKSLQLFENDFDKIFEGCFEEIS